MVAFLVLLIIAIFVVGHFGFPEKIDAAQYQETPPVSRIMRGAEPFRWAGTTEIGFLLVHGFEDSPFTVKGIAEMLHKEGHTVIAPLLPGHGTNIREFEKTRYEHWYRKVSDVYSRERTKFRYFFVVGFSMGGNLSLKLAIENSHSLPPTGLILISAPVFFYGFHNGRFVMRDFRLLFTGIIKYIFRFVPKAKKNVASQIINPWVGYSEAYTTACMHSLKLNVGKIRHLLRYITIPSCLIHATNDITVPVENLYYILGKLRSREKRAFLFSVDENLSTHHVLITHLQIREKVFHYLLKFVHDTLRDFDLRPVVFTEKKSWLTKFKQWSARYGS